MSHHLQVVVIVLAAIGIFEFGVVWGMVISAARHDAETRG